MEKTKSYLQEPRIIIPIPPRDVEQWKKEQRRELYTYCTLRVGSKRSACEF